MIEPATLQAMAAVGAMLTAAFAAIGGWVYWLHRDSERRLRDTEQRLTEQMERMEQRLTERMERMEQRLTERMDRMSDEMVRMQDRSTDQMDSMERRLTEQMNRNHREVLTLLEGHIHADGTPAVFRQVTPTADG